MPRKVSSGELEKDAEIKNQQDSQNDGNKMKAVARPKNKKKVLPLINANDTTNMIDLNTVGMLTSSLSEEIQKALQLVSFFLESTSFDPFWAFF